jgi:hypothetical protein
MKRRPTGLISERKAAKFLGMPRKELKRLRQLYSEPSEDAELQWLRCEEGVFYDLIRLEDYKQAQRA